MCTLSLMSANEREYPIVFALHFQYFMYIKQDSYHVEKKRIKIYAWTPIIKSDF